MSLTLFFAVLSFLLPFSTSYNHTIHSNHSNSNSSFIYIDQDDDHQLYISAILDSMHHHPTKIHPLKPLKPQNGMVTVVTYTDFPYPEGPYPLKYRIPKGTFIWVTPEGEVQSICQKWSFKGDTLAKRLTRLLGLRPNTRKTHFVTFSVPIERIVRPSYDPNPTTVYPCRDPMKIHCGQEFPADVPITHWEMIASWSKMSFGVGEKVYLDGYPWTRLGYTYDWSKSSGNKYGASEYVIMENTEVMILSYLEKDDYCSFSN